jgi:hypothetical protein
MARTLLHHGVSTGAARCLGVAHHTMSYALEEEPWREQMDSAVQIERPIQFIVRVGRAKHLARPSIRRLAVGVFENRMM